MSAFPEAHIEPSLHVTRNYPAVSSRSIFSRLPKTGAPAFVAPAAVAMKVPPPAAAAEAAAAAAVAAAVAAVLVAAVVVGVVMVSTAVVIFVAVTVVMVAVTAAMLLVVAVAVVLLGKMRGARGTSKTGDRSRACCFATTWSSKSRYYRTVGEAVGIGPHR